MLVKYKLINVGESPVAHIVPGYGMVTISEATLTDAIAEKLIGLGLTHYFEDLETEKTKPNGKGKANSSTDIGEQ